jgi:transposase
MRYINIGIDLSIKAQNVAQIRNDRGEKLGPNLTFSMAKGSLDKIYAQAKSYAGADDKIRFVIEATGMVWFLIALYAKLHNCEVVRVKAHKVHDLRKFYARGKKNDKIDAKTLAMMPVVDRDGLDEVYLPPAKNFALTRRCRQRERIVQELTAQKNRIESLSAWAFPGITECFSDPFGNVAKMFYRYYTNPFSVQQKTPAELAEHLSAVAGEKVKLATAQAICDCAAKACALYEGSDEYIDFEEIAREILPEIDLLDAYQAELKEVELEVDRLYEMVHPQRQIESIPGIGKNLGPAIYGAISDAWRFSREKRCRAFMGYVPRQDSSGKMDKKGLRMSQAGPSSARRDFYLAADVGRQWDPQLARVYYNEMVYKGHCHTQAVCAVGVRMIARVLRILKDNREYELRNINGRPITKKEAKQIINEQYIVPEEVRQRTRNRKKRERHNFAEGLSRGNRNIPHIRSRHNNSQRRFYVNPV